MTEMRECWMNVYMDEAVPRVGTAHPSRAEAHKGGLNGLGKFSPRIGFRIHVRLKPEGAPKRYADALDRWIWESGSKRVDTTVYAR